jgi:putative ABC transport system permease protein
MFKNYLKITFRNIVRQKGFSFINIFGLAVGMAVCILILLWVQFELTYDRFHKNSDDLYRIIKVWRKGEVAHQAVTPAPLAPALKEEFPEIIAAARFYSTGTWLLKHGETASYENRGVFTDPSVFHMFSFPLVKGNPQTALSHPNSIVLTEAMAARYFNDEDPIGKTLRVDNQYDFFVTGVMKNFPPNSHIQFDFAVPFLHVGREGLMEWLAQETLADWHNTSFYSYVLLKKNTPYRAVNRKISNYLKKHIPGSTSSLYLQPFKRIHLHSSHLVGGSIPGSGDISYIYLFSLMAFIVLLIACINFMNLATARSGTRANEIGVRKVVGARRTNIIGQFLGESLLLSFIAMIVAVMLVELFLPAFNTLTGKMLTLTSGLTGNLPILPGLLIVTLFTGLAAGSYPALFLSSFQPEKALKGTLKPGAAGYLPRKVLVIFQFSLTIIFIFSTIVISNQLDYMQNRKLGFEKAHLISMPIPEAHRQVYRSLKNELLQNSSIVNVTASASLPTFGRDISTPGVGWKGKDPDQNILMRGTGVDYGFIETFKMEMAAGRSFSRKFSADKSNYILNEAAIKAMGIESPLGKHFTLWDKTGTIIGVVKDYNFRSLHFKIEPLLLRLYEPQWLNFMFIRIKSEHIPQTLNFLESKWKTFAPGYPFRYRFVDDSLDRMYTTEKRIRTMFNYITFLAIFIACLGLFGLASFLAEQRTKEIGIRKVLGATVPGIVLLFSGKFVKWVMISNIIAWPAAYYLVNQWLQNFAYRTEIHMGIFIFSGLTALAVALLTLSYQSIKAATANPVEALRYE